MCCALFHGLFWQFRIWNLSKCPSVGPDGTCEYLLRHGQLARWIKWRTCDVREAKGGLDLLILQPFCHFTYFTTNSPTLPSLYLRHSSFSNPSVALPTPQFILQPFFRFSYVTSPSLNFPDEPPMTVMSENKLWLYRVLQEFMKRCQLSEHYSTGTIYSAIQLNEN